MTAVRTACATLTYILKHPAVRRRRIRAVSRYFGWQAWQATVGRPMTITILPGSRLRCYPHATSSSAVLYMRLPDWDEMNYLLRHLRPGDTFVDVGANVGVYSILASSIPDVRVEAFEPSTLSNARLIENVRLNQRADIRCHRTAVGENAGPVDLTCGLDTTNHVADPRRASE